MIKQTIVALLLSAGVSSVFAAGTVKVFSNGSSVLHPFCWTMKWNSP